MLFMNVNANKLKNLSPSLQSVVTEAINILDPLKIILFGSWARGDHRPTSDYDLVFELNETSRNKFTNFKVYMSENAPTLHDLDLIDLDCCKADFRKKILEEGIILYESKK